MLSHFRTLEACLVVAAAASLAACSDFLGRPAAPPQTAFEDSLTADSARRDTVAARQTRRRPPRTAARPPATTRARADTATPPAATTPTPAPRPPASAPIRRDLERLVSAQEQHLANVGRYASRTQYLALRYLPQAGVSLTILTASDSGWAGRATREGWDGSCVVWVGKVSAPRTARQNLQPPSAGIPLCDPS
jgi:hypothetical protein